MSERSGASDGSLATESARNTQEPFAWAIEVSRDVWSLTVIPHIARGWPQADVVPLYRSPTLTDAEREAIGVAIQCVEAAMAQRHPEEEDARDLLHKTSCTLSGLLERTRATGSE